MKGIVYTTGLLLALLIGLVVVFAIGAHVLSERSSVGYHAIAVKPIYLVRDQNIYDIKLLFSNEGNKPIKINYIEVFDGENILVFGDGGRIDKLDPNSYKDTLYGKTIEIQPGSSYVIREAHEVPDDFNLNPHVTITVDYTVIGVGEYNYTYATQISVNGNLIYGDNPPMVSPPTLPPPPPENCNKTITIDTGLSGWVKKTSPAGREPYVTMKITTYDGQRAIELTTAGNDEYGFTFYAYYSKVVFNASQTITVTGHVAVTDDMDDELAKPRRFGYLYVVSASNPSKILKQYKIAQYTDITWKTFNVTVSGVYESYMIAIGRPDSWEEDWRLAIYFNNVSISYIKIVPCNGGGSGGGGSSGSSGILKVSYTLKTSRARSYTTNKLAVRINKTIAPGLFSYENVSGHIHVYDSSGNTLQYSVIYYNKTVGVLWLGIVPSPSYIRFNTRHPTYTIYVKYGDTGDQPLPLTGKWDEYILERTESKDITYAETPIVEAYIDYDYYRVYTFLSDETQETTVKFIWEKQPPLGAIEFTLNENGGDTEYEIHFNTTSGTQYELSLSSCSDEPNNQISIRKRVGSSWVTVYTENTDCGDQHFMITASTDISKFNNEDIVYNIGEPIEFISIVPTWGDGGDSQLYYYVYPYYVSNRENMYNYQYLFYYLTVSVTSTQ